MTHDSDRSFSSAILNSAVFVLAGTRTLRNSVFLSDVRFPMMTMSHILSLHATAQVVYLV